MEADSALIEQHGIWFRFVLILTIMFVSIYVVHIQWKTINTLPQAHENPPGLLLKLGSHSATRGWALSWLGDFRERNGGLRSGKLESGPNGSEPRQQLAGGEKEPKPNNRSSGSH